MSRQWIKRRIMIKSEKLPLLSTPPTKDCTISKTFSGGWLITAPEPLLQRELASEVGMDESWLQRNHCWFLTTCDRVVSSLWFLEKGPCCLGAGLLCEIRRKCFPFFLKHRASQGQQDIRKLGSILRLLPGETWAQAGSLGKRGNGQSHGGWASDLPPTRDHPPPCPTSASLSFLPHPSQA